MTAIDALVVVNGGLFGADGLFVMSGLAAPRSVLLFVGTCALALAATALRPAGTNWGLVVVAAVVVVSVGLAIYLAPGSGLAILMLPTLPFVVDGVLAVLRQAQGGSTSGYAPLAILPVVWVALTQRRRYLPAITVCTTLLFAVPILVIGAPLYPNTGWRSVVLWTVVALVVGDVVHRVVDTQRKTALLADSRAASLDRLIETQTAISTSDLAVDGVMSLVAQEALAIVGGEGACVELADGDEVICSAAAGTALPFVGMRLKASETITGECFRTAQVLICTDSETDSRVAREACRTVGARSMILVPLAHGGDVKGVLIVWSALAHEFRNYEAQLLELLANTSGAALVRAELITELTTRAATDSLTGLTNRAAWYDGLEHAMARTRRYGQPLSVILLDLDDFKQVNDRHGHAAGDQVLRDISGRWLTALRETDQLGRLGGDEFGVILEDADQASALTVIARLHEAIGATHSASTGLAVWDRTEDSAALLARADASMYQHKRHRSTGQPGIVQRDSSLGKPPNTRLQSSSYGP
jgi:diguanylate cyclase